MLHRSLALVLAAVFALAAIPVVAPAQSDSGEIRIVVVDATTKQPVQLARILLDGPVMTSEFSGSNGQVRFTDVPDGIYRARVFKRGYNAVTSAQFEVIEGKAVTVSVSLAPDTSLKVIATVSVKSSASISTSSISNDSAQRKLSGDLADALNKLSGVSVTTNSDDSDATQTISLEGHDASQTQLTLDGIPLNAPGTAGDLRGFSTDLFSGASVRMGPQLGGLGGGVNFRTLDPTLSWESSATLSTGTNGKYNYAFSESGSMGKLGIAAMSTYRTSTSLVDGMRYLDASGLDYTHDGDRDSRGTLLKLRYRLNDAQALTGTFMDSLNTTDTVCLRETGALPCGYGPGNTHDSRFRLYSLTDNALIGDTQIQASLYGTRGAFTTDLLDRFINGEAQPTGYRTSTSSNGFTLNATLPAKERHTLSISAYGTQSTNTTTPLVAAANPYYHNAEKTSYAAVQLNDSMQSNTKLTLNESLGLSTASSAPASLLGSVGVNWKPTASDSYAASYSVGGVAAHAGRSTILTDPTLLRFDCNGDTAYGSAPGDQPGASSSTSARLRYTHSWRAGLVSTSLYRQAQNDVVLPAQVNGSVLGGLGVLPPGYVDIVRGVFTSPAGCGAPIGTPFGAQNLYFSTPVGGVRRVYEGGSISGYFTLGGLVVQPFYNVNVSKALTNDPRIANAYSITIPGRQLPNVPLHRAGLVLDYKAPHSALEWLADAQYTGANNWQNLPAHTTFDAGVSAQLDRGTLTFAANNITNTFAGIFASPLNAAPYQTAGGTLIPTVARPLSPRSYAVTYTVRFGENVRNGSSAGRRATDRGFGPGGPRGGPPRGGFRRMFSPLPSTPPTDPLAVVASQACTTQGASAAHTVLDPLKAYVAQIEAAKAAGGYPASMPVPTIPGASVTYHGLGSTYALTLVLKSAGANVREILPCVTMHFARPEDVASHHLYEPKNSVFFVPQLTFMPSVGLYFAARAPQAGQESFRVYALPSKPPTTPFDVHANDRCTSDLKATAITLLGELQKHFASGAAAPSWQIVPHAGSAGTWYELDANDASSVPAILFCGRVAAAPTDAITKLGYGAARPPALNYTPALGLYLERFGPRPAPSPSPKP